VLNSFLWRLKSYLITGLGIKSLDRNPNIRIARSASIKSNASINCSELGKIEIGEGTFINEMCSIYTYNSVIKIGNGVLIGPGTVLHTHHHSFQQTNVPILKQVGTGKPIIIQDDVWIGAHCTILGGVQIGAHSVIGAHSLVNKDIPPNSIAYGVPCKVKRQRNSKGN
jgi:acetyltransferase-like isoleucine patch superfamily enzyme